MRAAIVLSVLAGALLVASRPLGGPPLPRPTAGPVAPTPLLRSVPISATASAVDEQTERVFISGGGVLSPGRVTTLDAHSGGVLHTAMVGIEPYAMTLDPFTGRVFVSNITSGTVSVIDARSGALLRTVPVGGSPSTIVVDVATSRVFVLIAKRTSSGLVPPQGWVGVLDARSGDLLRRVAFPQGRELTAISADVAGRRIFVIAFGIGVTTGDDLVALDARNGSVLRTMHGLATGATASALAVDGRTDRVFLIAGTGIQVLDATTGALVRSIDIGDTQVDGFAIDPQRGRVLAPLEPPTSTRNPRGTLDILDARNGRVLHTLNFETPVATSPTIVDRTDRALVLLSSPASIDERTNTTTLTGPGTLVQLDASTGVVQHKVTLPDEVGYTGPGSANAVVAVARTNRIFVISNHFVNVYDATRL